MLCSHLTGIAENCMGGSWAFSRPLSFATQEEANEICLDLHHGLMFGTV